MFSKLTADYYGTPTPIQQLASFTTPRPGSSSSRLRRRRCRRSSGRSATPTSASTRRTTAELIRCVFPELTEERRKEYIKVARTKAEEGRVAVRNVRRHAKQDLDRALEKDGEVGKDDVSGAEKRLDALTKKHVDLIDDMLKHKEAELLEV